MFPQTFSPAMLAFNEGQLNKKVERISRRTKLKFSQLPPHISPKLQLRAPQSALHALAAMLSGVLDGD